MLKSGRPSSDGIRLGQAHEHRGQSASSMASAATRVPAVTNEALAEQQIARQVADQRQLRRDREIGALSPGLLGGLDDQAALPWRSPTVGLI